MDFGSILSRAWRIVWNNKFLMVLGFLSALGGGGVGGGNGSRFNFGGDEVTLSPRVAEDVGRFVSGYGALLAGLACVLFVVFIILWLLRLTAQGGLISAAARIDSGETVTFSEAFSAGTGHLMRLVGINLLMYGPFVLVGLLTAGVSVATIGSAILSDLSGNVADLEAVFGGTAIIMSCLVCFACLLVPLVILVTAIYPFAQRGAVLQELSVMDSVRHGWNIFRSNLANIILLALLFLFIGLVFGGIVLVVLLPLALLSIGPAMFEMITSNTLQAVDIITVAAGAICVTLVGAAVNAIMIAFRSTAVTLAYKEFAQKTA
jgi:hypothetical protein